MSLPRQNSPAKNGLQAIVLLLAMLAPSPVRSAPFSFYTLPYPFTNDRAETVHLSDWRGKPLILTMEYSNCRFMCTTTFSKMKAIQTAADEKKLAIDFMIISLDPKNDTPKAWQQYRVSREVDRSNWHLLTGSEATTREFAALIGIKYWYLDEHILHDFKIVRLNARGEIEKEITDYGDEPESLLQ
ncbi:MAG TPA: SCO family protein [Gallionella sp.]|nr:SCO family protein [Gallionella sp.]